MKLSCRYLLEQMEKREGFHLLWKVRQCLKHSEGESIFPLQYLIKLYLIRTVLIQPDFVNVCFWFIPPSMRGKEENADYWGKLAKVSFSPWNMISSSSSFNVAQTH